MEAPLKEGGEGRAEETPPRDEVVRGLIEGFRSSIDAGEDPGDAAAASLEAAGRLGIGPRSLAERLLLESLPRPARPEGPGPGERILSAAAALFSSQGFHETTVDMVADRAGLAKGTVYRYFKNKEVLFGEVIKAKEEELGDAVGRAALPNDDLFTAVAKYLAVYFSFLTKDASFHRLITREGPHAGVDPRALLPSKALINLPGLKHKALRAFRLGLIKGQDFTTVLHGIMGFVDGVLQRRLIAGELHLLTDDLEVVLETLFFGLAADEGRELKEDVMALLQELKKKGREDGS